MLTDNTMDKIFVSSTCYDLIDLRAEIEAELKNIGLNPIMSDMITSDFEIITNTNSIETCLINLRQASAVIIILSQRYGPSLKKAGFEDISATHLEYREAVKNNLPIYFYVRDSLEADFNVYNKTNDTKVLKWVKANDIKIFDLFEEHKQLKNEDRNNWYYSFTNVIDLKNRLRKDLKKESSKAILKQLLDSGIVPCITIENITAKIIPDTNILSFSVNSKNVGNSVAIQPAIVYYYASDYHENNEDGDDPLFEDHSVRTLETLLPSEFKRSEFTIKITEEEKNYGSIELVFEVSYATITGHYLSDLSTIHFEINPEEMKIKEIWTEYDAKKYYHSDAIKKEISKNSH